MHEAGISAVSPAEAAACRPSHVPQSPETTPIAVVLGWRGIAWDSMGVKGKCSFLAGAGRNFGVPVNSLLDLFRVRPSGIPERRDIHDMF
jgi:hypothetical protein